MLIAKLLSLSNCQHLFLSEARGILQTDMITSLVEKVSSMFSVKYFPSLEEITCAASLAQYGFIRSVRNMMLRHVDLSSIPADHLASLVSCVTWIVEIRIDASGFDLVRFLDSLRCEWLYVGVSMGRKETQALVRAMESHVVNVRIINVYPGRGDMTLDIKALTKYSGRGKCRHIQYYEYNYRKKLITWARNKKWKIELINNDPLYMTSPHH